MTDNVDKEYKLTLKKIFGHLKVVNKHRFKVFCLCCKVGIPWRGLTHDLSKYSPTEFFETARYFSEGRFGPIRTCKTVKGYSHAWIHHKNCNKHHYEYWYDYNARIQSPIVPFEYFLEMICDSFASGMTYQGKRWKKGYQLTYWLHVKDKSRIHPKMRRLLERVYREESEHGLDFVLDRKRLKKLYDEYTKKEVKVKEK